MSVNEGDTGKCHRIGRKDQNIPNRRIVIIIFSRQNSRRKMILSK